MKFIVWSSIAGFKVILYSLAYWVVVLVIEFVVKLIRRRKK